MRRCVYRKQLDLETLVCTRGPKAKVVWKGEMIKPSSASRKLKEFGPDTDYGLGSA